MRYFRCQCGKHTVLSSMGVADCDGCSECNTTLAEGPNGHRTPAGHKWVDHWEIDAATGVRSKHRLCLACMKKELIEADV